jgi:hypothetical protein
VFIVWARGEGIDPDWLIEIKVDAVISETEATTSQ